MSLLMSFSSQEKGIAVTTAAPPDAVVVASPATIDVTAIGTVVIAGAPEDSSTLLEDEESDPAAASVLIASALELAPLSAAAVELTSASPRELTESVLDAAEVASPEAVAVAASLTVVVEVKVLVSVARMMFRTRTPTVEVFCASALFKIAGTQETHYCRNGKVRGYGRGRRNLLASAGRGQTLFSSKLGGSLRSSCGT
jgi:hypothetical protein